MSIKQTLLVIMLGSSALVTINALNSIYYIELSWMLIAQVISGPTITFFLLSNKYKKYQVRVVILIFTFAGIAGLLQVLGEFAKFYLYGNSLMHPANVYIYHSIVSFIFIMIFIIWHLFDRKKIVKN